MSTPMMKLKYLVTRSLPRSKSKSKEKTTNNNNNNNTNTSATASPTSAPPSPPPPPLPPRNVIVPAKEVDKLKTKTPEKSPRRHSERPGKSPVRSPRRRLATTPTILLKHSVSKDGSASPSASDNTVNVNFNLNISDVKCACYKHLASCSDSGDGTASLLSDTNSTGTLPKLRTRIKTNPWLPSPRTTPGHTPDETPISSTTTTPGAYPTNFHPTFDRDSDTHTIDSGVRVSSESLDSYNIKAHSGSSDIDSVHRSAFSESENPRRGNTNKDEYRKLPIHLSRCNELSSCESLDEDTIEQIIDKQQPLAKISFEYEEAFESQVEAHTHGCIVTSSRDDVSDGYGSEDDVFLGSGSLKRRMELQLRKNMLLRQSRMTVADDYSSSSDEDEEQVWYPREDLQQGSGDTDDTLCDTPKRRETFVSSDSPIRDVFASKIPPPPPPPRGRSSPNGRQAARWTYAQARPYSAPLVKRGSYSVAKSLDDTVMKNFWESESMVDSGIMTSSMTSEVNRSFGSDHSGYHDNQSFECDTDPEMLRNRSDGDRSVTDIRSSLQEKVALLRREKAIVDDAIRTAREEERMRVAAKARMAQQLTSHRKEILLRTLRDLKSRLDGQSRRLQSAYSSVLNIRQQSAAPSGVVS